MATFAENKTKKRRREKTEDVIGQEVERKEMWKCRRRRP
jgi:hypothetical protein